MKYHILSMALWIRSGLFAVCYAILWHCLFRKTWKVVDSFSVMFRSSRPEVFIRKGVLKIYRKFTGEHPCRSVISIKLLCNFIEITLQHRDLPGRQIKTCLCMYISVLSSIYYLDKPIIFAKFLCKHKRKHSYM